MVSSQETIDVVEVIDSMNTVECDVTEGIFRAEYDSNRDPASLAVVAVVATADNSDPVGLNPLHSAIDTGALDDLFPASPSSDQRSRFVSFSYEGFEVTVFSDGTVEADPVENA